LTTSFSGIIVELQWVQYCDIAAIL